MALVGLFLLPCDYRAGAELPHPHSLLQLWIDAADGVIAHDHAGAVEEPPDSDHAPDWFDPTAGGTHDVFGTASSQRPDLGDQQQSAPTISGLHVLTAIAALLPDLARVDSPTAARVRRLVGNQPRVLVPPPR